MNGHYDESERGAPYIDRANPYSADSTTASCGGAGLGATSTIGVGEAPAPGDGFAESVV